MDHDWETQFQVDLMGFIKGDNNSRNTMIFTIGLTSPTHTDSFFFAVIFVFLVRPAPAHVRITDHDSTSSVDTTSAVRMRLVYLLRRSVPSPVTPRMAELYYL